MPKLYIGDLQNRPIRLKKMYIGNENNNPIKLKKIWIGDQNNYPRLIFSEGLPDGYLYDYNASEGQYNQSSVTSIINSVNGLPHALQVQTPSFPNSSKSWGLSSVGGRKKSFNNYNVDCGRGGTFRLPYPVNDATLMMVKRFDNTMLQGFQDTFFNMIYFNEAGYFGGNSSNDNTYSGRKIADFTFRYQDRVFKYTGTSSYSEINFTDKNIGIYWMKTEGTNQRIRIRLFNGYTWERLNPKLLNIPYQDIRVCDYWGGGVLALTGEIYRFTIWPKSLSENEMLEAEQSIIETWND